VSTSEWRGRKLRDDLQKLYKDAALHLAEIRNSIIGYLARVAEGNPLTMAMMRRVSLETSPRDWCQDPQPLSCFRTVSCGALLLPMQVSDPERWAMRSFVERRSKNHGCAAELRRSPGAASSG